MMVSKWFYFFYSAFANCLLGVYTTVALSVDTDGHRGARAVLEYPFIFRGIFRVIKAVY